MNKPINFLIFIVGATVGSVTTWFYLKNKYEQITQDEIDSAKETFFNRNTDFSETAEDIDIRTKADNAKEKPSVVEYATRLREYNYMNYSETKKEEEKESMSADAPYVITPEEFGDIDDYDNISLTYYADQILADDNDELIENVEDVVGFESLNSFGEYEDDSVFVRNDILKCDYEILLDHRKYIDIVNKKPKNPS